MSFNKCFSKSQATSNIKDQPQRPGGITRFAIIPGQSNYDELLDLLVKWAEAFNAHLPNFGLDVACFHAACEEDLKRGQQLVDELGRPARVVPVFSIEQCSYRQALQVLMAVRPGTVEFPIAKNVAKMPDASLESKVGSGLRFWVFREGWGDDINIDPVLNFLNEIQSSQSSAKFANKLAKEGFDVNSDVVTEYIFAIIGEYVAATDVVSRGFLLNQGWARTDIEAPDGRFVNVNSNDGQAKLKADDDNANSNIGRVLSMRKVIF